MVEISGQISSDKVNALIAKYNHVCAESTRYRNFEWQITAWVVALLVGMAHLAVHEIGDLCHAVCSLQRSWPFLPRGRRDAATLGMFTFA